MYKKLLAIICCICLIMASFPVQLYALTNVELDNNDQEKENSTAHEEHGKKHKKDKWKLVWDDEFDGDKIDTNRWNYVEGAGGYGNNELQYYSDRIENAYIEDGKLIIQALEEDFEGAPYTSAKLTTEGKGDWTYGKYEIRAKLPYGQGIWPAIWMMPSDYEVYGIWPSCGEIDIMELVGHEPNKVYGTLHYGMPRKYTGDYYELAEGETFADDFHVFSIEWEPGEIRWYVDDVLYQTQNDWYSQHTDEAAEYTYPAPFDRDFYLQLNVAVGGDWPGYPDETTIFPQKMEIDYVRVYQLKNSKYDYPVMPPEDSDEDFYEARPPLDDGNYVYNGGFDTDLSDVEGIDDVSNTDYWTFSTYNGGIASVINEDGILKVDIDDGGNVGYGVQLLQQPMSLEEGATYRASFDAKASDYRSVTIKIGGDSDRGWASYSENQFNISPIMENYSFEFVMEEESDTNARYEFNIGLDESDLWFDNVRLEKIADTIDDGTRAVLSNGNYIYNSTFDQGTDRMIYWYFITDDSALATALVNGEIYKRELYVKIAEGGDELESIQVVHKGLNIEEDEKYSVEFDARAKKPRSIEVTLARADGYNYITPQEVKLTKDMEKHSFEFTMDHETDIETQLVFNLGLHKNDVYIDNVKIEKMKKPIEMEDYAHIEGEDYFDMLGIQTEDCSEGGLNVGWIDDGDWMKYELDVEQAGEYIILARVASSTDAAEIIIENEDGSLLEQEVPNTGSWQSWATLEEKVYLNEGLQTITILGYGYNINWFEVSRNLIKNGNLDEDIDNWSNWYDDLETYSNISAENKELEVFITDDGSEPWSVYVFQEGIKLEEGRNYKLCYDSRATIDRAIGTALEKNGGDPKYLNETTSLVNDMTKYTYQFTMDESIDDQAKLTLLLGQIEGVDLTVAHAVYLDNFELYQISEIEIIDDQNSGDEILYNGTFDNGTDSWDSWWGDEWTGNASGSMEVEDAELKVTIESIGGASYSPQVFQEGLKFIQGGSYTVSFDAKTSVERKMILNIGEGLDYDPWFIPYLESKIVDLSTNTQHYSFTFTMEEESCDNAKIVFELGNIESGNSSAEVYIDNISIIRN